MMGSIFQSGRFSLNGYEGTVIFAAVHPQGNWGSAGFIFDPGQEGSESACRALYRAGKKLETAALEKPDKGEMREILADEAILADSKKRLKTIQFRGKNLTSGCWEVSEKDVTGMVAELNQHLNGKLEVKDLQPLIWFS